VRALLNFTSKCCCGRLRVQFEGKERHPDRRYMVAHSVVWQEAKCRASELLFGSLKASYNESSSLQLCPYPPVMEIKQSKS